LFEEGETAVKRVVDHRGHPPGDCSIRAAIHVPAAGHFSNIAHYIAATDPCRRPGPTENGPDVKSLFELSRVLGSFRNFAHRQDAVGSFRKN
jgi:hypothetical protein